MKNNPKLRTWLIRGTCCYCIQSTTAHAIDTDGDGMDDLVDPYDDNMASPTSRKDTFNRLPILISSYINSAESNAVPGSAS